MNQNVTSLVISSTQHLHVILILNKTQRHVMVLFCYIICVYVTSTLMTFLTTDLSTRLPHTHHCDQVFSFLRQEIKHAAIILALGNPFLLMLESIPQNSRTSLVCRVAKIAIGRAARQQISHECMVTKWQLLIKVKLVEIAI
jgi:hypothetical protein